jgi:hypothetical protein
MTWLDRLAAELTARGLTGAARRRILVELRDHIECEPGCEERLGDPRELAAGFADELATDRARRSAFHVFAALAVAAVALVVSQVALASVVGYPGFKSGLTMALFFPALIGLFVAPQVALVAGSLAALRAVRRRRERTLPAAELGLIRRRARVALGAGYGVVAGLGLYMVNFGHVLPVWWLALVGGLSALAAGALFAASTSLARAGSVMSAAGGEAGDVFDDLPLIGVRWLRVRPWRLGVVASVAAAIVLMLFEAHAEHSWIEGIQRGAVEGLAAGLGFALLGRAIGVRPDPARARDER